MQPTVEISVGPSLWALLERVPNLSLLGPRSPALPAVCSASRGFPFSVKKHHGPQGCPSQTSGGHPCHFPSHPCVTRPCQFCLLSLRCCCFTPSDSLWPSLPPTWSPCPNPPLPWAHSLLAASMISEHIHSVIWHIC